VILLDAQVEMGYRSIDEQAADECPDIMALSPKVDVNGDKESKDGEPPTDRVDDQRLSSIGELIKEVTE
jgi:hypothetical protein